MAKRGKISLPRSAVRRHQVLKGLYMSKEGTHYERCRSVASATGLRVATIYEHAKKGNWRDEYEAVEDQKERINDLAEVTAAIGSEEIRQMKDVSFTSITSDIKDFTALVVKTTKSITGVSAVMIQHYAGRIQQLLAARGYDPDRFTTVEAMKVELWEKKIQKYQSMIQEYIRPNAVVQYLDLIGLRGAVSPLPDDAELGALTPVKLLQALAEVGFDSIVGNVKAEQELYAEVQEAGIELPEINAMKVKDEANQLNMAEVEDGQSGQAGWVEQPKKEKKINLFKNLEGI